LLISKNFVGIGKNALPLFRISLLIMVIFTGLLSWIGVLFAQSSAPELSPEQFQAYQDSFQKNRTHEKGLGFCLKKAFRENEYVAISFGLVPIAGAKGIPVRITQYDFDNLFISHQPGNTTTFIVTSGHHWWDAVDLICRYADSSIEVTSSGFVTPGGVVYTELILLFHLPRQHFLEIGGLTYVLSESAQAYLSLTAVSDYQAHRNVLIIQEPHYELDRQYALLKGLEVFFTDNPRMLMESRTVFLAEGLPSDKQLSVDPLLKADRKPSDFLIHQILGTFLIPGYVAYEWKHQQDIPILGVEDPGLYRISAAVWSDIQSGKDSGLELVWPYTVAARNTRIANTLLSALKKHENPVLFVGGKHLSPLSKRELIKNSDWQRLQAVLDSAELAKIRQSNISSIVEILKPKGIGFYFLSARGSPFLDVQLEAQAIQQYAALFHTQLGELGPDYLQQFGNRSDSVTVSPSTEAAAQAVSAIKGGDKGGGKNREGNGGGGDGGNPNWISNLKGLLQGIKNAFRGHSAGEQGKGPTEIGSDGKEKPQGLPDGDWEWSSDPQNKRGGRWIDKSKNPHGGASWDGDSKIPHWDVDDGKGNRSRYDEDGRPLGTEEVH